jgi:hypothetical protein
MLSYPVADSREGSPMDIDIVDLEKFPPDTTSFQSRQPLPDQSKPSWGKNCCSWTFPMPHVNAWPSYEKIGMYEFRRLPMTDSRAEHLVACQAKIEPEWVTPLLQESEKQQFAQNLYEKHIKYIHKERDYPPTSSLPFDPTQRETEKFVIEFYLAVFEDNFYKNLKNNENNLLMSIDNMYQWYAFYVRQSDYGNAHPKQTINLQTWRQVVRNIDSIMRVNGNEMYTQHTQGRQTQHVPILLQQFYQYPNYTTHHGQ